jgi:hypothetical protein
MAVSPPDAYKVAFTDDDVARSAAIAIIVKLVDSQRPEDAKRDEDVEERGHTQGRIHRPRELTSRVAQVSGGEGDDAEAEIRKEGEGNARDDVREWRIPAEGQKLEVDVDQRHGDEDSEDGEQYNDDQAMASTIAEVKTLSHHPAASAPTKSEVA